MGTIATGAMREMMGVMAATTDGTMAAMTIEETTGEMIAEMIAGMIAAVILETDKTTGTTLGAATKRKSQRLALRKKNAAVRTEKRTRDMKRLDEKRNARSVKKSEGRGAQSRGGRNSEKARREAKIRRGSTQKGRGR